MFGDVSLRRVLGVGQCVTMSVCTCRLAKGHPGQSCYFDDPLPHTLGPMRASSCKETLLLLEGSACG